MAASVKQVICINWGTKYGPDYVNRLYGMVARNITPPFTFTCFTDNELRGLVICDITSPFVIEDWGLWDFSLKAALTKAVSDVHLGGELGRCEYDRDVVERVRDFVRHLGTLVQLNLDSRECTLGNPRCHVLASHRQAQLCWADISRHGWGKIAGLLQCHCSVRV